MNVSLAGNSEYNRARGRLILLGLILLFALPAIVAKVILVQNWYQSGVTNKGVLIEPRLTYSMLNINMPVPLTKVPVPVSWHLGFVMPEVCDTLCLQQIHLLRQSHTALGKYQSRVTPVIYLTEASDKVSPEGFAFVHVNQAFVDRVGLSEYLITDPLGQLVMKYLPAGGSASLIKQHKGLLSDLRKLLKLSRVG